MRLSSSSCVLDVPSAGFFFLAYFLSFPTALDAALGFVGAQHSTHPTLSSQSARAIAAPGAILQRGLI